MRKKYIVIPGMIFTPNQIIKLFGVNSRECITPTSVEKIESYYESYYKGIHPNSLIPLRPQEDDDYSLEKAAVDFVREKLIGAS